MRLLLSLLVVVVVAGTAHADNREEARKEFTAGQAADRDKDYQAAIEHYLRAYELVPHHFALFNIATAYERLGQLRESAQWFERYLDEAPQSLVKERREVEKLILELKLRPAKLTVTTAPPGARVLIDGQPVGVTPYIKAIRGGGHRVRVELQGQREERDVALEYGEPQSIELTLNVTRPVPTNSTDHTGSAPFRNVPQTQTSGMLRVTGGPEGALVAIDDQVVGRIGGEFHVEPGEHNLKVTLYGHQTHDQSVSVTTGAATDIAVQLKPGTGTESTGAAQGVFGYYIGAVVGADMRGTGAQYMGELGYRVWTLDVGLRVGKVSSRTTLDVIFRWTFMRSKFSPFVQAGYSAASSADDDGSGTSSSNLSGYVVGGGLRYDLMRRETTAVSLLAESGIRIQATSSSADENTMFIPLLVSLHATFGGKTNR